MEELLTGLKLNKKGVLTLILLGGALVGLALAVYMVGQKQAFKPKAYEGLNQPVISPPSEVSLSLKAPSQVQKGQSVEVRIYLHSDTDPANLVSTKLKFPPDLLKVEGIKTEKSVFTNWATQSFDNNKGTVTLIGGVPSPGITTEAGSAGVVMAEITFTAQGEGLANLTLGESKVFRNSDNTNILTLKRDASFKVVE